MLAAARTCWLEMVSLCGCRILVKNVDLRLRIFLMQLLWKESSLCESTVVRAADSMPYVSMGMMVAL